MWKNFDNEKTLHKGHRSILLEWKKQLQVGVAAQESDRDGQWPLTGKHTVGPAMLVGRFR